MFECRSRHIHCDRTRVDTVQKPDTRCDATGPSPAAATSIKPFGPGAQPVEIEDSEVQFEQVVELAVSQLRLIEAGPLDLESVDSPGIQVVLRHNDW